MTFPIHFQLSYSIYHFHNSIQISFSMLLFSCSIDEAVSWAPSTYSFSILAAPCHGVVSTYASERRLQKSPRSIRLHYISVSGNVSLYYVDESGHSGKVSTMTQMVFWLLKANLT